jgi:DNA polymerase-3 subunit chi
MTRIHFHLLPDRSSGARDVYACQQAQAAYSKGRGVLIYTTDAEHSRQLDFLLWSFRDSSFVPHCLLNTGDTGAEPDAAPANTVHISYGENVGGHHGLLINLADSIPRFFSRFDELQEIVIDHEDDLERSRKRYRYYLDQGYPLEHHRIRQRILSQ